MTKERRPHPHEDPDQDVPTDRQAPHEPTPFADPRQNDAAPADDALTTPSYPASDTEPAICQYCGAEIPSTFETCPECHLKIKSDTESPPTNSIPQRWTFSHIGIVIVSATHEHTAVLIGKIALKYRSDWDGRLRRRDSDSYTLLSNLQGTPASTYTDGWPPLHPAVKLDTDRGRRILTTAIEHSIFREDLHPVIVTAFERTTPEDAKPHLYNQRGETITSRETLDNLLSTDTETPTWLVPAIINRRTWEITDRPTQWLDCPLCCQPTQHVFDDYEPTHPAINDRGPPIWLCLNCDLRHSGPDPDD
ncbi:MAG: hypothetical protein ABEH65_10055 [Halobacteriales archaeon]